MGNRKDHYYNKSKQEGYRSRAAYKLQQLDDRFDVLFGGASVVDLGAAPGGWLQVAAERAGARGKVVGVDFQSITQFDTDAGLETVRGDMTEDETRQRVRDAANGSADVVVSDMAPDMTGEYDLDHARSVHLARQALETARELLDAGGHFVVKVFDGRDFQDLLADIEDEFAFVATHSPDASRDASSELYVVGKNHIVAPIAEGDEHTVEIVDTGDEGDGIARIEGYTLFVDDAAEGDTVDVTVTDLKPNYGFAERRDGA
ncbi:MULTISPECIES: 23S rRNA (uridine(2552)-2'-O)-methyltransferase [Halobacterium]|uniref:23S rRNA (uridine(2552)-2'-O)-methyltransferase n=1 Tax=Halobacterium TaxID=2239 RepID=UPI00196518A8|nr:MULTISPECIES: 23S rRNA (uridine(2552)-2'-O)-methyltransferase [Halobacterium]MCF2206537.1 TRAM domain-containing protein [Halobacterium salinarum]MCF2241122.1 TRAM domain-containing protein [Halobacterium salinarum]MDL0122783.1 23S rRNA (uridine(2552)-2'-O)-methyltransferase [Halobacterium salinarum]MDL0129143.1 23S rRNA (uridine(2552)-2'-O)-methyltransferase [Halobacterium salinarum]QRY24510.1 23S rRNA (uridine(2552)-2'-O)-methyltransferase [Halobacterium sp. BOL4-2]